MRKVLFILCLLPSLLSAATTNQITSREGITWQFANSVTFGRFVSGDYWVLTNAVLTNINPLTVTTNGRTVNGSQVNPRAWTTTGFSQREAQGYDNMMFGPYGSAYAFSNHLNVGSVSPTAAMVIPTNATLWSSWSIGASNSRPQLYAMSVLTFLTAEPPSDAFRPQPYAGTKATNYTYSGLNWSALRTLAVVSNTPTFAAIETNFFGFIPEQYNGGPWTQYTRPLTNCPNYNYDMNYGAYAAEAMGDALLKVNLDYTQAQKSNLVVWLVQYGLDIYGAVLDGADFTANGGLNTGRKAPMLFAGQMLSDATILARANGSNYFVFQEDEQTFYVPSTHVISSSTVYTNGSNVRSSTNGSAYWQTLEEWTGGSPGSGVLDKYRERYSNDHVGIAEWGIAHSYSTSLDGSNLDAAYRDINVRALSGNLLAMRVMGLQDEWNWPAVFDYMTRIRATKATNGLPARYWQSPLPDYGALSWFTSFPDSMWNNYASDTGYVPTIVTNNASGARVMGFRGLGMSVLPIPSVNTTADLWQTFEFTDPTVANLTANDNTSTGTWLTNDNTVLISTSTTGERALLGTVNGSADTGHTRGLLKSHTANDTANVQFDLGGSAVATISAGVWFKFVGPTPNVNKTIFDFSNSGGEIIEVAMEGTTKMVGFSGGSNNGVALVSGNFYWITAKVTQNATSYVRVYDTTGALVGTEVSATAGNQTIRYISLGDTLNETADNSILTYWDDFVLDWTDATYPLGL